MSKRDAIGGVSLGNVGRVIHFRIDNCGPFGQDDLMILYVETDAIHGELLNTLNWIQFIGSERSYHLLYTHMISIETELMVYQSISIDRLWGTLDENQLQ